MIYANVVHVEAGCMALLVPVKTWKKRKAFSSSTRVHKRETFWVRIKETRFFVFLGASKFRAVSTDEAVFLLLLAMPAAGIALSSTIIVLA
jgi:hypothetical protein